MRDGEPSAVPLVAIVPALQRSSGHVFGQIDFGDYQIGVIGRERLHRHRVEIQISSGHENVDGQIGIAECQRFGNAGLAETEGSGAGSLVEKGLVLL